MKPSAFGKLFEENLKKSRGTRIQRALRTPIKAVTSKCLTTFMPPAWSFRIRARTFWGDRLILELPELASLGIYQFGFTEEGLTRMVLEYLKPGVTFVDIGAHFGYYTLLGSAIVGPHGQVHSFEPTPASFSVLRCNAGAKENVVLNNCAVSGVTGKRSFYDCGARHSGHNSLLDLGGWDDPSIGGINAREIEVRTVALDEYVWAARIVPGFIKIDAENSEYEILEGMARVIDEFRPVISLEVGDTNRNCNKSSADRIKYLMERSYTAYEYRGGRIVEHQLLDKYSYDNILCLPD